MLAASLTLLALAHWRAQTDAPPQMKVLVVVSGLLRSFRETWPVVSQQLQLDSPSLDVDIVVASDLGTPCSWKDVHENRCPHEWTRPSLVEVRRDLARTYGPRLRHIEDQSGEHSGGGGRAFEARVLRLLRSHTVAWADYSITLALRPDVIFVQPHPMGEHRFITLDLAQVCAEFPGLRIVGGSQSRSSVCNARHTPVTAFACPLLRGGSASNVARSRLCTPVSCRIACPAEPPHTRTAHHTHTDTH
jgi:hypothetical protein